MASETEWWQLALAAAGGFMAALMSAFRAAWNLSNQISDLKVTMTAQNAALVEKLTAKFEAQLAIQAAEYKAEIHALEERVRSLERQAARKNGP
jgi:polyhydroxyalkanoate synthesis regulator phasin